VEQIGEVELLFLFSTIPYDILMDCILVKSNDESKAIFSGKNISENT